MITNHNYIINDSVLIEFENLFNLMKIQEIFLIFWNIIWNIRF